MITDILAGLPSALMANVSREIKDITTSFHRVRSSAIAILNFFATLITWGELE
jgi:hypothetical protein